MITGLINYPSLPDKSIAMKVNASRQAVSKIKKRFYRQGVLSMTNILDLAALDFEILVLAHSRFNPNTPLKERGRGVEMMINDIPQIMMVSGNYENVLLGGFYTYQEYNEIRTEIFKVYKYNNFFQGEPKVVLLPLKDLAYLRRHDYGPVVKYLLSDD